VEKLIVKLAAEFSDKKRRLMFLINNYDLLVSILDRYEQRSIGGEKQHFAHALEERMLEFVQEELKPTFGFLLSFLTELESQSLDSVSDGNICFYLNVNINQSYTIIDRKIRKMLSRFRNELEGRIADH
jgi:hypothetical protein